MRWLCGILLTGLCAGLMTHGARAQEDGAGVEIKRIVAGFLSYVPEESVGRFKIGLWTPVAVDVLAGPAGLTNAELVVETPDSEDMATVYKTPIPVMGNGEQRTVLAYTKPGNSEGRFNISIRQNGRDVAGPISVSQVPLDLQARLYLTIGGNLPALQEGLIALRQVQQEGGQEQNKHGTFPRFGAFETDPARLPTLALGYDAVDLMILTTADATFVQALLRDPARVQAISRWVGQGGRLVISVSWENQAEVARFLQLPAWQPRVPVRLPAVRLQAPENTTPELSEATAWAHVNNMPFPAPGRQPVPLALLQSEQAHAQWEVLAQTRRDGRPLIAKMPYGRGSITLLAFELDKGAFTSWNGRSAFLKGLVSNLEPRIAQGGVDQNIGLGAAGSAAGQDLTTQLQTSLDAFDVPLIPFGWVALFIVVYILIVGPLDYFLLKRVFKRLEWTWITFPALVLLVSAVAYFTANAVKGHDLKVNKVDLVDFDLRTDLDEQMRTGRVHVYGRTWFSIMSPLIKSYTIGVEPHVANWWGDTKRAGSEDQIALSWLGRPEIDGPGAMGRARMQGWSRRSYDYAAAARGLKDVPIPVWTTKSFTASWATVLPPGRLPVRAELTYYAKGEGKVTGKLHSLLPVDLEDVWIIYRGFAFPLEEKLVGSKDGKGPEQAIEIVEGRGENRKDLPHWPDSGARRPAPFQGKGFSDPTPLLKDIMFHERVDTGTNQRNYNLHRLDLSWRLEEARAGVREVILYGRLPAAAGASEDIMRQQPMPTLLWLGELPGPDKQRPPLAGTMVQDTYVRIIIPVRPGD